MADNDNRIVQKLKWLCRNFYYEHSYNKLPTNEEGADTLIEYINSDQPFMACRMGATESRVVYNWMQNQDYSETMRSRATQWTGIFPNNKQDLYRFAQIYTDSINDADVMFTWGCYKEPKIIKKFAKHDVKILRDTTNLFLFNKKQWTTALKGKRVLIITPFDETSKKQYELRNKLFNDEILPEFKNISFIRTVQSSAGNDLYCGFNSWFDALDYMCKLIDTQDFDIALISGGAYGIPLASYIKRKGKQAIHIASHLQILFGIRGRRFDNWPEWAACFNEYWAYPSDNETPSGKHIVEGGSYWK